MRLRAGREDGEGSENLARERAQLDRKAATDQRGEAAAPVDVGDALHEDESATASIQRTLEQREDAALPRSQGSQQVRIRPADGHERNAAVRGGSEHRVGATLESREGLRQSGSRGRDVAADEHGVAGKLRNLTGNSGQALSERDPLLRDPKRGSCR